MARTKTPNSPTGVFIARSAGVFKIKDKLHPKGKLYRYHVGETFPADHPLLRVRPSAFAPVTFGDEQAMTPLAEEAEV